jgi:hypothetical protein
MQTPHRADLALTLPGYNNKMPLDCIAEACKLGRVTSVSLAGLSDLNVADFLGNDVVEFHAARCRQGFSMAGVASTLSEDRSLTRFKLNDCNMSQGSFSELSGIKGQLQDLELWNCKVAADACLCDLEGLFAIPGLKNLSVCHIDFDFREVEHCSCHPGKAEFIRTIRESKIETLEIDGMDKGIAMMVGRGLSGNSCLKELSVNNFEILPLLVDTLKSGENKTLCTVHGLYTRDAFFNNLHWQLCELLENNSEFQGKKLRAEKRTASEMAALVWCWENTSATLAHIPIEVLATHVKRFSLKLPVHRLDKRVEELGDMPPRKRQRLDLIKKQC